MLQGTTLQAWQCYTDKFLHMYVHYLLSVTYIHCEFGIIFLSCVVTEQVI